MGPMRAFSSFIDEMELIDMPLQGRYGQEVGQCPRLIDFWLSGIGRSTFLR